LVLIHYSEHGDFAFIRLWIHALANEDPPNAMRAFNGDTAIPSAKKVVFGKAEPLPLQATSKAAAWAEASGRAAGP
jgi:hypothetical protein